MLSNNTQYLDSVAQFEFLLASSNNAWRQLGVMTVEEFLEHLQKDECTG